MTTKFIHLRRCDYVITPDLQVEEQISAHGGVTVAYDITNDSVRYAVAKCHDKDRYVKAEGRNRSQGRLLSGRPEFVQTLALDRTSGAAIQDQIINDMFDKKLIK